MASKKSKGKAKRTAAQKRATAKMIAANKARKRASGGGQRVKVKRAKGAPPAGLGARVARLEGQVSGLRVDVDAHTALFRHIADNTRGLFAAPSGARQLGAGRG